MRNRSKLEGGRIPTYTPPVGVVPICPHCGEEIDGVYQQQVDESLGKAFMWSCMKCRKVLGVSHRKGFWMG
ncbi:MAG: hypothetical protein GY929_09385 [Actinomycetia bacterium]|nr:hypothetical protein [Actinomycetes bacterium]